MSSSGDSKTRCPHDHHHDFKQEIEESIRRCEQLLSIDPPILYHATCIEGKGSSRRNSRSSGKGSGRGVSSRVEPSTSGSGDLERRSAEIDPEWRKNMGLLINVQDGNVTTVTPIAADEEAVVETPLDEDGNPPDERVATEYNFSFDDTKGSSGSDTIPQSISITTRTVTRESRSDITSESGITEDIDWSYDNSGQSPSPSSSASEIPSHSSSKSKIPSHESSKSELASHASSKSPGSSPPSMTKSSLTSSKSKSGSASASGSELSGRLASNDTRDLDVESDRYSDAASGSVTRSEREMARARASRERANLEFMTRESGGEFEERTTRRQEGDYEVVTTERCAIFPRHRGSPSPPSSPPSSVKIMSLPTSPRSRSPKNPRTPKSPRAEPEPDRILLDAITFSFNTPQPYTEDWEWVGECSGIKSDRHRFEGAVVEENLDRVNGRPPMRQMQGGAHSGGDGMPKRIKERIKIRARSRLVTRKVDDSRKSPAGMRGRGGDQLGANRAGGPSGKASGPTARLRHLSKPRTDLYQKLAHTRAQLEEEHMSECSFKPRVGRRPDPHSQYSAPLIHRVTGIEKRVDLRKRARKVIEKEELDQCSFWPQINSNSEYLDINQYKPIEERALEYQKRREAKIAMARAIEDQEKGLTFRPEINPKSVKIFKQTGLETINIADRLTASGSFYSDNKGSGARPLPKNECTFTPEINSNTDLIIRASKLLEGCTPDFFSRQQYWQQRAEMKKKAKEQQIQSELSFKPNIDANSDSILKTSPIGEVFDQSLNKRVDRLYHRDLERRKHIRRKISDAYYAQFTHSPAIDHTSRLLARSSSSYDLFKNEKGNKTRERIKSVIEDNFEKAHPFRPKMYRSRSIEKIREDMKLISNSPRKPSADKMEDILHRRRQFRLEKARVLDEMKVIRELQEFKECTFKPHVNRAPPKDQEPVVVKGLGRFLELQDLAKQMKKDQEDWERKIFYQHVYALPKRQYTIPKPFSFAHRVSRSYSARQQKEERRTGCTVRFSFHNKVKERSEFVDFYECSHPTPKNPKWKDLTRWLTPEDDPRFTVIDAAQGDISFGP